MALYINSRQPWPAPVMLLMKLFSCSRNRHFLVAGGILAVMCFYLLFGFSGSDIHASYSVLAVENVPAKTKFSKDRHVQHFSTKTTSCETIHVVMVCSGYNRTREVTTMLKSIVFHRRYNPLHFYFVTDPVAQSILQVLMLSWLLPDVEYSFFDSDLIVNDVAWIKNYHYSGNYGLMKLALPDLLATAGLHKALVIDTDLMFAADVAALWKLFDSFNSSQSIGIADNLSDWYLESSPVLVSDAGEHSMLPDQQPHWPAIGRGFNSGVMLMNLDKLSQMQWTKTYKKVARDLLPRYGAVALADQDIFNAVFVLHPDMVYRLPCTWNMQLSLLSRLDELCKTENNYEVGIVHWNTPTKRLRNYYYDEKSGKKFLIRNRQYFHNMFLMFQQMDGNLLRHESSIGARCKSSSRQKSTRNHFFPFKNRQPANVLPPVDLVRALFASPPSPPYAKNDLPSDPVNVGAIDDEEDNLDPSSGYCSDFRHANQTLYRTHLFYMEYDSSLISSLPTFDDDVTLVTQLSIDRLHLLVPLAAGWSGPISLALYTTDADAVQLLEYLEASPHFLSQRRNIAYHVVYRDGPLYPINLLRNIALKTAFTPHVFLCDIDFVPKRGMYESLRQFLAQKSKEKNKKVAYVVPAFETRRYRLDLTEFPANKSALLNMWLHQNNSSDVMPFRFDVWPQGQAPTNYSQWIGAAQPYEVQWQQDYEPYIVVRRDVALYDQRFLGFGWNKVSHVMELTVQGYKFYVLNDEFIIHMSHAPSFEITRFRSSDRYRKCLQLLKCEFVNDLTKRYGKSGTRNLRNVTEVWCGGMDYRYIRQLEKFGW